MIGNLGSLLSKLILSSPEDAEVIRAHLVLEAQADFFNKLVSIPIKEK